MSQVIKMNEYAYTHAMQQLALKSIAIMGKQRS
jgi:hypothetical protein